jgi:hypothetical protein
VEELRTITMDVAGIFKLIAKKDLSRVIVDTTVQESYCTPHRQQAALDSPLQGGRGDQTQLHRA